MKVAIIYTSMSGNTKLFAEMIHDNLKGVYQTSMYRLELDGVPDVRKYDALVLGTYTWGKGELPTIHKDMAYDIQHKPKNVFVFGTGETQFGEQQYCRGAEKLHKYYESTLEVGKVEQTPTDSQEPIALAWIEKLKIKLEELKLNNIKSEVTEERNEFLKLMGEESKETSLYEKMYNLQKKFDDSLNQKRNIKFSNEKFLTLNNFAIISELGELLDELSWPWWKEKEYDKDGVLNELRDLQHFVLKSFILLDIGPDEYISYIKKELSKLDTDHYNQESLIDGYIYLVLENALSVNRKMNEESEADGQLSDLEHLTSLLVGSAAGGVELDTEFRHTLVDQMMLFQTAILVFQRHLGLEIKDAFDSYVDKNIENHNRQKGKSKDATRTNYSTSAVATKVELEGDYFVAYNEEGHKVIITKETLFELNRL